MPHVDLRFRVTGNEIDADHGYLLFSAISECLPKLHGLGKQQGVPHHTGLATAIAVHPISGILAGRRRLLLARGSALTLRLPSERVGEVLPLAGAQLRVGGDSITVGVPEVHALEPNTALHSRLVVIKGALEPAAFLESVKRQLGERSIGGTASLSRRVRDTPLEGGRGVDIEKNPYLRRTIRIRGREIVGYAVDVYGLGPEASLRLQEEGIGGRRRFGCGVFVGAEKRC